ncbi:MAG: hypothetical protein KatS3mg056_3152 [Chloroflexus sp.]|nr:MAG: hypothetical protein KatS3mg056_3152 [Chloroflexus sp.]
MGNWLLPTSSMRLRHPVLRDNVVLCILTVCLYGLLTA